MPARVLFVSHTAELNGAERMLLQFLRALDRKAFRPALVLPGRGPLLVEAERAGVPTAVVPMKWWLTDGARAWKQPLAWIRNVPALLRLRALIKSRAIDLVCSNSAAAMGGALAARLAGRPHVWIIHEILTGRRPLLRFLFGNGRLVALIKRWSVAVVANSMAGLEAFQGFRGATVVYNSVRSPARRSPGEASLRRRLGITPGERVVGLVGKITPEKGQLELLRAAALSRGEVRGLKVLFVGAAADTRYLAGIHREARRLGVEDILAFAGYVDDVFTVLPLLSLLVSASRVESFGRTLIEAQACGVPVLAVRTGGVPEVIRHGENGFLADSNDPRTLAGAMVEFFKKKKADIARVVRNGRKNVAGRYAEDAQVRRLEAVLKGALGERGRGR